MAGFLDRAKEQAQSALNQGKEKVGEVQAQRDGKDLVRRLGAAYYAQIRHAGPQSAVDDALRALDEHVRVHGDATLRP